MTARIAIGVGCRLGCPADAIEALVRQTVRIMQPRQAQDRQGCDRPPLSGWAGLFTIEDKAGERGLVEAAGRLGLSLTFLPRDTLRQQSAFIQTRSELAENLFGVPSVAEAAALAGAGPNAELIVPRISSQDATCAIAGARDDPS